MAELWVLHFLRCQGRDVLSEADVLLAFWGGVLTG